MLNTCSRSCSVRPARFATSRSCRRRGGRLSPGASVRSDAPTAPRTSAGWRARRRNAKSKIARGVAPGPMELLALQCEAARSPSGARRNGRHGATAGGWNAANLRNSVGAGCAAPLGRPAAAQCKDEAQVGPEAWPGNWRRWTTTLNGERGLLVCRSVIPITLAHAKSCYYQLLIYVHSYLTFRLRREEKRNDYNERQNSWSDSVCSRSQSSVCTIRPRDGGPSSQHTWTVAGKRRQWLRRCWMHNAVRGRIRCKRNNGALV